MITFFDLIQDDGFRNFVSSRIADGAQEAYSFSQTLPLLYRYRSLSPYAIDDIINNKITLTSIGEFNDVFDGAMHQYGTMEEIKKTIEVKWAEMEAVRKKACLPEPLLQKDDFVKPYIEHLKTECRLKFRELDYLGTYVCCFSQENSSTLMWAHYADSNKGICMEYDFNKLPSQNNDCLLRNSILPVAYTPTPIDLSDLLDDNGSKIYKYPLDAAVLCTALNKAPVWQYEKEWRIIWVLAYSSEECKRLPINSIIKPSKIYLGYHFLKAFFYYDNSEREKSLAMLNKFISLIEFIEENNIKVAVMVPSVGNYQLKPCDISADALHKFMLQHFGNGRPESMRYYYVIHDYLMDLIEEIQEDVYV